MTEVTTSQSQDPAELSAADEQVLRELTERARAGGPRLTGEGGLLGKLTKMVIEGALEGELDDHLGYARHDPAGRDGGNSRNGHRPKTLITETGPVELSVLRDRDSSFEPKIVAKRQRRLTGAGELVISLSAFERADPRGDRRAPGRGVWRGGIRADDHCDHRPGDGGPGGLAKQAIGFRLRGDLHRRHQCEDPRGPGRQPADLPRPGGHRGRGARRAGPVGREHGDGEGCGTPTSSFRRIPAAARGGNTPVRVLAVFELGR